MSILVDVEDEAWMAIPDLEEMARLTLVTGLASQGLRDHCHEISLVFTSDEVIAQINRDWRGKEGPTNVLSFPAEDLPLPAGEARPLGDIMLAFGTVHREALEQGKPLPHHAAHLMIHGLLHLLGFDHHDDAKAHDMEQLEIGILKGLGISNPYERP